MRSICFANACGVTAWTRRTVTVAGHRGWWRDASHGGAAHNRPWRSAASGGAMQLSHSVSPPVRRQHSRRQQRAHRRGLDERNVRVPGVRVGRIAVAGIEHDDLRKLRRRWRETGLQVPQTPPSPAAPARHPSSGRPDGVYCVAAGSGSKPQPPKTAQSSSPDKPSVMNTRVDVAGTRAASGSSTGACNWWCTAWMATACG